MQKLKTFIIGLWKVFVGAVLCQAWPTSILAVGWSYRAMQRRALRVWQKHSPLDASNRAALAQSDPLFLAHETWPNWFIQQKALRRASTKPQSWQARVRRTIGMAGASLGENLKVGFLGMFNTTVVMILPAGLWQIGWYTGWDNSFNKGYEQYYVGIALSWTGVMLFLAAMLFLPMAQARQAATGDWRAFYQFRTIWAVTRNAPVRTVLLAAAYSLCSLPIAFALGFLFFLEQAVPASATFTASEMMQFLIRYYFRLAIYGFMAYVFVRWIAAGWYARTIVELLHTGRLKADALAGAERHALRVLQLDHEGEAAQLHPAIAVTLAVSRPVWRAAVLTGAVLVWFTFVAQIYVREFIVYHPYQGFLNQPLVQLPWFRYVPALLEQSARAEAREAENSPISGDLTP